PGHGLERASTPVAAQHRAREAVARVLAVEEAVGPLAQEALRDRIVGIALQADGAAVLVHGHQDGAGIRAIAAAGGGPDGLAHASSLGLVRLSRDPPPSRPATAPAGRGGSGAII